MVQLLYYSSLALYLVQLPPLLSLSPLLSLLVKKFSSIFEVGVAGLLKVGLIFFQCLEFLCLKMLFLVYFCSYNYKSYFLSLIFDPRAID